MTETTVKESLLSTNIIDMGIIQQKNKKYVLRYCASELSIPCKAIHIILIFGKSYITGNQTNFNNKTGLPFGYCYMIEKGQDIANYRKIEIDILADKKIPDLDEPNYFYSYDAFVKYYNDEKFPEPQYEDDECYCKEDEKDEEIIDNFKHDMLNLDDIYDSESE